MSKKAAVVFKVLEWRLSGGTEESDESFNKNIHCPIQDLNSAAHE
jgi:hypothetical protein